MDKTLRTLFANKAILLSVFALFFCSYSFSQINTFTGATNSNWNTASNWSLTTVPLASHDVVIPSGKTANISLDSYANSVSISGNLTISNNKRLTVYGNFTVNPTGSFTMPGGSGIATLVVYGNYINNGASDFWKSNVLIAGDLLSPSTSTLQNQGNVIVGGNIIGDFSITGGSGSSQIYALNPNAIVTITPTSIDNVVVPGTPVLSPPESTALVDLINQVMYSGSCPFTISAVLNVSVCPANNAVFTVSTSGASPTYQWQVNTGSGWVNLANNAVYSGVLTPTLTVNNVNVAMDGYKYRASITAASCTKNGDFGKLILAPSLSAPIIGAITQPTCALPSGSVVLSGLPASGVLYPGSISYSGTSYTVTGLSPGTYAFSASNVTCSTLVSANVVINPLITTTWNGSTWSNGMPSGDKNIVFGGNFSTTSNLDACSCVINAGMTVTVNSGHTFTISSAVTAMGGSLTLENNASLLQSGYTGVNSGNIIVKRSSTPIVLGDYTYWSSPTSGSQTLLNFSPNTAADFFTYHNAWAYASPASDTFTKGIGYAIIAPQGTDVSVPSTVAFQFTGVPNNGNVDVPIALGPNPISNRLIGNPYPSAIDANAFINANLVGTGTINQTISGTLYFWTHNHSISGSEYLSSDYATYNLSGGTAVASGRGNTVAPLNYIASGQGFFVHTIANGNVSFRNTMRTGTSNTNFYKTANNTTAVPTVLESHRIWLNLTNSTSNFSQILLGYIQTATNDVNPGLDGLYYGADQHVLYSLIDNEPYTIQAKSLPFANTDVVPLGYKVNVAGQTTISLDHVDGVFSGNQNIYLLDQLLNVTHDLKAAPYTFASQAGTFNNRFVVRYTSAALGNGGFDLQNKVTVATGKNQITIKSESEAIDQVILFDMFGRKIHENTRINNNEFQISGLLTHQTLIAQIILADGQVIAKKLVY